jgi:hypothetical protein
VQTATELTRNNSKKNVGPREWVGGYGAVQPWVWIA